MGEDIDVRSQHSRASSTSSTHQRFNSSLSQSQNGSKVIYDMTIINDDPKKLKNRDIFRMCSNADVIQYKG